MFGRPARAADLETALSIDPFSFGGELVGRAKALAAYAQLVRTGRMFSTVVEMPRAGGGRQMIGFGGAVFVSNAFFEEEIGNPKPGLNSRIIASIVRKRPVVLTHDEVGRDNSSGGLNVVITQAGCVPNTLNAEQTSAFESVMAYAFFQLMRGYRLRRVFREAGSAEAIAHVKSQQVFAQMVTFDRYHAAHPASQWNHDRALFVAEREHCLSLPASVASMLFTYSEPVMSLRDTDQELLLAALEGLTDAELADVLDLKLPALKKRWASLFDRVGRVRPDLVPQSDRETAGTRGPQKRHRLLAYLREHPEELRPRSAKPSRRPR